MDLSLDNLQAFAEEQWWVILIAVIALILIIKIVKTFVKWLIIIVIVLGVLYYGFQYAPVVETVDEGLNAAQVAIFKAMTGEAEDSTYTLHEDGTFTIKSGTLRLEGELGSNIVEAHIGPLSWDIPVDETVKLFIDTAKNSQSNK